MVMYYNPDKYKYVMHNKSFAVRDGGTVNQTGIVLPHGHHGRYPLRDELLVLTSLNNISDTSIWKIDDVSKLDMLEFIDASEYWWNESPYKMERKLAKSIFYKKMNDVSILYDGYDDDDSRSDYEDSYTGNYTRHKKSWKWQEGWGGDSYSWDADDWNWVKPTTHKTKMELLIEKIKEKNESLT